MASPFTSLYIKPKLNSGSNFHIELKKFSEAIPTSSDFFFFLKYKLFCSKEEIVHIYRVCTNLKNYNLKEDTYIKN